MPDSAFFHVVDPLSLERIAEIAGCTIQNKGGVTLLSGVAPIDAAGENDVTFLSNKKYAVALETCKAGACILDSAHAHHAPAHMALLISANPYASYAKLATFFYPEPPAHPAISPQAFIAASAKIGAGCTIEPGAFLGENATVGNHCFIASGAYIDRGVTLGDHCHISHGVTISHAVLGSHILLHPGVKIGQDGFGFATERGVHLKVPQLGRVLIRDHVEIGANSCIDRGAGPDTIIGEGTKIDNLVQIGHNVQMGRGCIIVSHVGISGSTKLGDYVVLGGQVGVAGHLNIGSMVNVAAQSGVMNDIPDKTIIGGSPAIPVKQWHRQTIALKKLAKQKVKHD